MQLIPIQTAFSSNWPSINGLTLSKAAPYTKGYNMDPKRGFMVANNLQIFLMKMKIWKFTWHSHNNYKANYLWCKEIFLKKRTFENVHKTATNVDICSRFVILTKGSVLRTMIFPSFLPILKFIKIIALYLSHLALRVHQKLTVLVWNFKKYLKKVLFSFSKWEREN